jgi:hypothetical protein
MDFKSAQPLEGRDNQASPIPNREHLLQTALCIRAQSAELRAVAESDDQSAGASRSSLLQSPAILQAKEIGSFVSSKRVKEAAAQGVSGQSRQLPHLDRVQASFGNHDLSNVQAYVGGAAKGANDAIGAQAFASGNKVAFKENPSLHTAAHEAAHVVQQRAGVSLDGGVGKTGDRYEKHADQVADAVVQGENATPLLDVHSDTGRGMAAPAVQLKAKDGKKIVTGTAMQRLGHAKKAIEYTKSILEFGAGNQIEALQNSRFGSNFRLHVARSKKYWSMTPEAKKVADKDKAAYRAARAEMAQGGNCGEHANLAYQYLRHSAVGEEIARGNVAGFDHAFTFVGPAGGHKNMSETAVADPWPTAPKAVLWQDHFAEPVMDKPEDLQTQGAMVADGGNPKDLIKKGLTLSKQGYAIINHKLSQKEADDKIDKHEDERAEKAQLQDEMKVLSDRWNDLEAQLDGGGLKDDEKKKVVDEQNQIAKEYKEKKERLDEIKIWMWGQVNAHEDGHDYDYEEAKPAPAPEKVEPPAPEKEPSWMSRMWAAVSSFF